MADHSKGWSQPPQSIQLGSDEVHVWRVRLDLCPSRLESLEPLLSSDEIERARRFRFQVHRDQFVARRGLLRNIRAQYLNVAPVEVHLQYEAHGKPVLARTCGERKLCSGRHAPRVDELRFNLSHSPELALVAVAQERDVGIDLERIRPAIIKGKIAERFCSSREVIGL